MWRSALFFTVYGDGPVINVVPEAPTHIGNGENSRLQDMLNWAIEHSDPEKLKEQATQQRNIREELGEDVYRAMFEQESSNYLDVVQTIRNATASDDEVSDALYMLEELVTQVDNARNLHRMGGMVPTANLIFDAARAPQLRLEAAWALGTAANNNGPVQAQLMQLGILELLLEQVYSPAPFGCAIPEGDAEWDFCQKLLYLTSSLLRNELEFQKDADSRGLFSWIMENIARHPRNIQKKELGLLTVVAAQSKELAWIAAAVEKIEMVSSMLRADHDEDFVEKVLEFVLELLRAHSFDLPLNFKEEVATILTKCEDSAPLKTVWEQIEDRVEVAARERIKFEL